ncbi:MAG: hypothetical protein ACP5OJ_09170, partial [Methanothermobacter sp.]
MLFTIIMLVLFIFLMVFIFSTALLTPLIGKRNLIFVLSLGFIVGLVGGVFFIAPLYDDMPDMARYIFTTSTDSPEVIHVNISTVNDVNAFVDDTKKIDGVRNVTTDQITIKTSEFNKDDWEASMKKRLPVLDSGIESVQVPSNDTIVLKLNDNSNPTQIVENVNEWLQLVGGIDSYIGLAEVSITVDPSQVDSVSEQLPQDEVAITEVTGPVEDQITAFKKNLPDITSVVLICGFIGLLVGAIGLFIDSLSQIWDKIRLRTELRKRK